MPDLTPAERKLRGRIAAEISWANTENRSARTAPARKAHDDKFLVEAGGDPQRAEHLRRAHYARMALRSAQARRRRAAPRPGGGAVVTTERHGPPKIEVGPDATNAEAESRDSGSHTTPDEHKDTAFGRHTDRFATLRLTVGRVLVPPRVRSRLRWQGRERLALWLDIVCGEDTP